MRTMLYFDLPTLTNSDKKAYRKFRKYLIKNGFIMLQWSVYVKMFLNQSAVDAMMKQSEKEKPAKGNIMVLTITEAQFSKIKFLLGGFNTDIINDDSRVTII